VPRPRGQPALFIEQGYDSGVRSATRIEHTFDSQWLMRKGGRRVRMRGSTGHSRPLPAPISL